MLDRVLFVRNEDGELVVVRITKKQAKDRKKGT